MRTDAVHQERPGGGLIRKATLGDAAAIFEVIESFARTGTMLARPLAEVYADLRDFIVYDDGGVVAGIASLHIWGADIGEVRSLAVRQEYSGRGIGRALLNSCIEDARSIGLKKVFALTYKTGFFERMGFYVVDKLVLPQKIWGDCIKCSKFPSCDETALMKELT